MNFNNGCIGLLQAIDTYDINHPSKALFVTYAYHYIRARITYYMRQNDGLIHVPRNAKQNVKYKFYDYDELSKFIQDETNDFMQYE